MVARNPCQASKCTGEDPHATEKDKLIFSQNLFFLVQLAYGATDSLYKE